ncbi:hypothetical protein ANN_14270 [Periplaneta americana]|uniref:Uncharacterized protein n=1 Tax=Periplaneta americana TaxID=6978 RepID=A0ABQ8SVU9_PERAM|nr:hypothetical protein ANN_14270 [Periplaneta americana]
MAGLCESGNEPPGSLEAICDNAGKMSPGSSTESYPAFAHIELKETPKKNLYQITCPNRESNPGHLVSRSDALTVTPQGATANEADIAPYGQLHMAQTEEQSPYFSRDSK